MNQDMGVVTVVQWCSELVGGILHQRLYFILSIAPGSNIIIIIRNRGRSEKGKWVRMIEEDREGFRRKEEGREGVGRREEGREGVRKREEGREGVGRREEGMEVVRRREEGREGVRRREEGW